MSIHHVGIDLHKQTSQVAVLTDAGELTQHRLPNDQATIEAFFRTVPRPARIAIEATGTWWWLVDLLQDLGHDVALSHPKQTRAIAAARLKNDRVDAERLALLLRANLLPTVWIPPRDLRDARELLRHRLTLVRLRTRVKNQLWTLCARRNLQPMTTRSWFTVRGQRELTALPLPETPAAIIADYQAALRLLDQQITTLDARLVERFAREDAVVRLQTIPGIGPLLAIVLVLEIGDIQRFPSARHLASYVGLSPRIRASGEHTHTGHISKEGNPTLRWALVVAATQVARQPGPLRQWYRALASRKGKAIARIALARRLAEIVYSVWAEGSDYNPTRLRCAVQG